MFGFALSVDRYKFGLSFYPDDGLRIKLSLKTTSTDRQI